VPHNRDYNGETQEGVGYYQRTIRNGRRASAAHSFLRPVMRRPNLHVVTNAVTRRLTFDGGRVTGIEYRWRGELVRALAGREVILSAGAIGSPHLLQISGIGAPDMLREIGVEVRHALPGVGEGLQDHYAVRVAHRVTRPITLNERARGMRLYWEIAKWLATGRGLLAFSPAHVAAFVRSRAGLECPDLQFVFTPASYSVGVIGQLQPFPGMTIGVWQMRPESKGFVRARTADPEDAPAIQPNYLSAVADQRAIVEGLRWCRRFLATDALRPYRGPETVPGTDVTTDEELLDYARQHGATVYHAVSTCRMGHDPRAVVSFDLKVHGMAGLRVVDASVMPTMPSANTNAATLMIAEKASDLIAGN
jgi:choline dehydrogenase